MRPGAHRSPCAAAGESAARPGHRTIRGAAGATRLTARVALALAFGLPLAAGVAHAAVGRDLLDPPARPAATSGTGPWIDSQGADHRRRDAERQARESPPAPPAAGTVAGAPGEPGTQRPADGGPGTRPAPRAADPDQAEALRRQGERERDARSRRGGLAPPPEPVSRIRPDAAQSPAMSPPPRIAIPQPGEPGGSPIAVPTCGPAGCFDANGRALPDAGVGMPMTPGGRPCIRLGNAVTC